MKIVLHMHRGDVEVERRMRAEPGVEVARVKSEEDLARELGGCRAAVISASCYSPAVARMVADARELEWIQSAAAGYDPFVLNGVRPGISVTNATGVWGPTVAEHAMSLLLGLTRCLPRAERNRTRHDYDREATADVVRSLEGGRLLVVGFGTIGREVARRARAFGMHVVGVNRSGDASRDADEMMAIDNLRDGLAGADAVVLCIPLMDNTRKLIGADELSAMRNRAILVNVSRGGIVDQRALAKALREGVIAGAGLDVFDPEPLAPDDPLWDLPNVILTPHVGGYAAASFERLADLVAENARRMRAGEELINRINPAEFGH